MAAVVGVAGAGVSMEAIAGLANAVGPLVVMAGSVIGFLAVFTSFILLSSSFQALLHFDFKMPKAGAHLIVSGLPALLYVLGAHDFVMIVAAVGAVAVGTDAALIIATQRTLQRIRKYRLTIWSYVWSIGIYTMVIAGIAYEVYLLFIKS